MSDLDNNYKLYSPAVVPFAENETEDQTDERWAEFDALAEDVKEKLLSLEVAEIIFNIAESFKLSPQKAAFISRAVRGSYSGKNPKEQWAQYFVSNIGVDASVAENIAQRVSKEVLGATLESIMVNSGSRKSISISDAITQFPDVAEQVISSMPLKLRISPNPVKPSVKNWIADYREQMGMGKHGTFDRGNFLFHGENSKRLTSVERQKLSAILKSLDDETPLSINPDKQEIIFENLQEDERTQQVAAPVETKPQPNAEILSNMQSANMTSQPSKQPLMQAVQSRPVISQSNAQEFSKPISQTSKPMTSPAISLKSLGAKQFTVRGALPQVTSANVQPNIDGMKQDLAGSGRGITNITDKKMPTFERKTSNTQFVSAGVGEMTINSGWQKSPIAPVAQPIRKETLQHMNLETGEKIDNYFGVQSAGAKMESFPKQVPAPKKEFENKSPNFSQLLKAQAEPSKKVADEDVKKKPVTVPAGAQQKPIAGKVVFSSPQQLSVEKRAVPKRSPYRITPREDE